MRVALVHDWLVQQRGGEQVLRELCLLYPQADVFTLVHVPGTTDVAIERHRVHTSFIQRLPLAPKRFRAFLPLFFAAIDRLDLRTYDLVISTSHCVAMGVRTHAQQLHVSYVHSPMRYLYDQMPQYLPARGQSLSVPLVRALTAPWRRLDKKRAQRPQALVANSRFVSARIARVWGRRSSFVHPPVDVAYFNAALQQPKALRPRRGLLCVAALVPYKRIDAALALSQAAQMPLTIVGQGPQLARLQAQAGPQVRFVARLGRAELRQAFACAEAFVFAGEEDFGIVAVEAMAAGCPVLALGRGGMPESVGAADGQTGSGGVLFAEAEPGAMLQALHALRAGQRLGQWGEQQLLAHAARFSPQRFVAAWQQEVRQAALAFGKDL